MRTHPDVGDPNPSQETESLPDPEHPQAARRVMHQSECGSRRMAHMDVWTKSRSGDSAVSDVCSLRGVDHSNNLQLNPRRQQVKKTSPTAEQHRDLVDLQLVEDTCGKRCLCV